MSTSPETKSLDPCQKARAKSRVAMQPMPAIMASPAALEAAAFRRPERSTCRYLSVILPCAELAMTQDMPLTASWAILEASPAVAMDLSADRLMALPPAAPTRPKATRPLLIMRDSFQSRENAMPKAAMTPATAASTRPSLLEIPSCIVSQCAPICVVMAPGPCLLDPATPCSRMAAKVLCLRCVC